MKKDPNFIFSILLYLEFSICYIMNILKVFPIFYISIKDFCRQNIASIKERRRIPKGHSNSQFENNLCSRIAFSALILKQHWKMLCPSIFYFKLKLKKMYFIHSNYLISDLIFHYIQLYTLGHIAVLCGSYLRLHNLTFIDLLNHIEWNTFQWPKTSFFHLIFKEIQHVTFGYQIKTT